MAGSLGLRCRRPHFLAEVGVEIMGRPGDMVYLPGLSEFREVDMPQVDFSKMGNDELIEAAYSSWTAGIR
jgi:hypothetical protein